MNPTAPLGPHGLHVPQPFPVNESLLKLSFLPCFPASTKVLVPGPESLLRLSQAKPLHLAECGDDPLNSLVLGQACLSLKTSNLYT